MKNNPNCWQFKKAERLFLSVVFIYGYNYIQKRHTQKRSDANIAQKYHK